MIFWLYVDPKSGLFPIPVDVRTEIIKARKIRKQKKTKNRVGSIEYYFLIRQIKERYKIGGKLIKASLASG